MSNPEHTEAIYPTRSPPVSPTITVPNFNTPFDPSLSLSSLSRANSLARLGSEMHPLPPLPLSASYSPYPPATPSAAGGPTSPPITHRRIPPPINTTFSTAHSPMGTPVMNSFVTAGGANTPNNHANNHANNNNNIVKNSTPMDLRELSLVRWRTGHAFVIFGYF